MKRIHVHLRVKELETSVAFYTRIFAEPPALRRSDYARWMLDDPRVNFAISSTGDGAGIEHLGIQAETREELEALRLRIAGLDAADHEGETVCCYARSDKSWITDDQEVKWELFHTHGAAETYHEEAADRSAAPCCAPSCCETEAAGAPVPAAG